MAITVRLNILRGDCGALFGKVWGTTLAEVTPSLRGTCYVHIGTHKTGSTSLQTFLRSNVDELASHGVHVPVSGQLTDSPEGSGHHCVAWDLLGSDADAPISGTVERLIAEIGAMGLPIVCLSSEEFIHLYLAPNKLQRLNVGLAGIGYRMVLIVYFRPQADYLEALYAEVSRHAPVRDFWECYREMLVHGAANLWPDSFTTMFDYERLLAPFAKIVGPRNLILRPFVRDREPHRLVTDFMQTIIGRRRLRSLAVTPLARINAGRRFGDVLSGILINRPDLDFASMPWTAERERSGISCGPFDPLRPHEMLRIALKFGASNLRLSLRYGVALGCVSRPALMRAIRALFASGHPKYERFALLRHAFNSGRAADPTRESASAVNFVGDGQSLDTKR